MKKNNQQQPGHLSLHMLSEKEKKQSKRKIGFFSGLLIGMLTVAAFVSLFAVALWFDLFSLKHEMVQFMQLEKTQFEALEERHLEVMKQEIELINFEDELKAAEITLERRRTELDALEAVLHEEEAKLDRRAESIAGQEAEIDDLVLLYESMQPQQAAQILLLSEDKAMTARILGRMEQKRLTMILGQVNPEEAATLINLLSDTTGASQIVQPDESES